MLIDHYREKELGEDSGKTYATRRTYEGYFRKMNIKLAPVLLEMGRHGLAL
jgi:hypothetical protein